MKSFDLVVISGPKASQKNIIPLVNGKNIIGSDGESHCKINSKLVKPKHFQLNTNKSGNFSLVPLVEGMQLQQKNGKMKELKTNQDYEITSKDRFYIDRTLACSFEESSTKKGLKNQQVWTSTSVVEEIEPKKKQKKQTASESEEVKEQKKATLKRRSSKIESEEAEVEQKPTKKQQKSTKVDKKEKPEAKQSKKGKKAEKEVEQVEEEDAEEEEVEVEEEQEKEDEKKKNAKGKRSKRNLRIILSNCELTDKEKESIEKLGGIFVDDLSSDINVVVMNEFKRRAKLLVGLNKGAAIVSKNWILDCIDDSELIQDFSDYYLEVSEEDKEKYGDLDLDEVQSTLKNNKPANLFKKYQFILPEGQNHNDLKAIIESGSGISADSLEQIQKNNRQVVQLIPQDKYKKSKSKQQKVRNADPEFVLLSSLKQEIQEDLFLD